MAINPQDVRKEAFTLYSGWQGRWSEHSGDNITVFKWFEDLMEYSPKDVEVREAHDHILFIVPASVGDEAGTWTLYVVADDNAEGEIIIHAIWQVFDTMPSAVYERVDAEVGTWFNVPD